MKNKEVISGLIGGSFFAATYLAVGIPLIPSAIIAASAFVGGELLMSKTNVVNFDTSNIKSILNDAKNRNKTIFKMISKIDDEDVKKYLKEIYMTVDKIIETVSKNKKKISQTKKFFTYYLPITEGIVLKYDEIENQKLSSNDAKKFFKSSKESLKEINTSFKKILDNLYENDISDAEADMKVLNNILKSDGFNEIKVDKEESDE